METFLFASAIIAFVGTVLMLMVRAQLKKQAHKQD